MGALSTGGAPTGTQSGDVATRAGAGRIDADPKPTAKNYEPVQKTGEAAGENKNSISGNKTQRSVDLDESTDSTRMAEVVRANKMAEAIKEEKISNEGGDTPASHMTV